MSFKYFITGIVVGIFIFYLYLARFQKPKEKEPETNNLVITNVKKEPIYIYNAFPKEESFHNVGHLHNSSRILPLYGRPIHRGSNRYNYYTLSDGSIPIKLSFSHEQRMCDDEYGCNELYDNDVVHIAEYNDTFSVSLHKKHLRYNPFISLE